MLEVMFASRKIRYTGVRYTGKELRIEENKYLDLAEYKVSWKLWKIDDNIGREDIIKAIKENGGIVIFGSGALTFLITDIVRIDTQKLNWIIVYNSNVFEGTVRVTILAKDPLFTRLKEEAEKIGEHVQLVNANE